MNERRTTTDDARLHRHRRPGRGVIVAAVVVAAVVVVFGRGIGDEDRSPGLSAMELRHLRTITFWVGVPGYGSGTAFLISKESRLLVTAAHVADIFLEKGSMTARQDRTNVLYRVKRVHYPEGLKREYHGMVVESPDFAFGPVAKLTLDIAFLELAESDHPLPDPGEGIVVAQAHVGQVVGHLGFSGDRASFDSPAIPPTAELRTGKIRRPSRSRAFWQTADFLYTDIPLDEGDSGGPVFSTDGKIIGLSAWNWIPSEETTTNPGFRSVFIRGGRILESYERWRGRLDPDQEVP